MKKIGLIGGMSFYSSAMYYNVINEEIKNKLGENNSAEIIMHSLNFQEIKQLQFQEEKGWQALNNKMSEVAKKIEVAGADLIAICTNLMHKTADAIKQEVQIPLLHIVDATAESIKKTGVDKVLILGTIFTMKDQFYKKPLSEKYNLEVITPSEDEMQETSRVIYEELCQGIFLPKSKSFLQKVIKNAEKQGARGVILGCTELPIILKDKDSNIPLFNTTKLHALSISKAALAN